MQFLVPKFIGRKTKLVGPLTFKQLLYVVGEGVFVFVFYFVLPKAMFWGLVFIALIVTAAFIFVKPGGQSLSSIFQHLGKFIAAPKQYIWKKKTVTPSLNIVLTKAKPPVPKKQHEKLLEIAPMSRLRLLETKIDTKKI